MDLDEAMDSLPDHPGLDRLRLKVIVNPNYVTEIRAALDRLKSAGRVVAV